MNNSVDEIEEGEIVEDVKPKKLLPRRYAYYGSDSPGKHEKKCKQPRWSPASAKTKAKKHSKTCRKNNTKNQKLDTEEKSVGLYPDDGLPNGCYESPKSTFKQDLNLFRSSFQNPYPFVKSPFLQKYRSPNRLKSFPKLLEDYTKSRNIKLKRFTVRKGKAPKKKEFSKGELPKPPAKVQPLPQTEDISSDSEIEILSENPPNSKKFTSNSLENVIDVKSEDEDEEELRRIALATCIKRLDKDQEDDDDNNKVATRQLLANENSSESLSTDAFCSVINPDNYEIVDMEVSAEEDCADEENNASLFVIDKNPCGGNEKSNLCSVSSQSELCDIPNVIINQLSEDFEEETLRAQLILSMNKRKEAKRMFQEENARNHSALQYPIKSEIIPNVKLDSQDSYVDNTPMQPFEELKPKCDNQLFNYSRETLSTGPSIPFELYLKYESLANVSCPVQESYEGVAQMESQVLPQKELGHFECNFTNVSCPVQPSFEEVEQTKRQGLTQAEIGLLEYANMMNASFSIQQSNERALSLRDENLTRQIKTDPECSESVIFQKHDLHGRENFSEDLWPKRTIDFFPTAMHNKEKLPISPKHDKSKVKNVKLVNVVPPILPNIISMPQQRIVITINNGSSSDESEEEDIPRLNSAAEKETVANSIDALLTNARLSSESTESEDKSKHVSVLSKAQQEEYNALKRILAKKDKLSFVSQQAAHKEKVESARKNEIAQRISIMKEKEKKVEDLIVITSAEVAVKKAAFMEEKSKIQLLEEQLASAKKAKVANFKSWHKCDSKLTALKKSRSKCKDIICLLQSQLKNKVLPLNGKPVASIDSNLSPNINSTQYAIGTL